MTAKSFGKPVESEEELLEAIPTYTARAAEKLRKQASAATSINVFFHTNAFKKDTLHVGERLLLSDREQAQMQVMFQSIEKSQAS